MSSSGNEKTLYLYWPQHREKLSITESVKRLSAAPFGIFLEFTDPRTDTYVQATFPFYYMPVHTFGLKGRCFVTAWKGLHLYVPSDLHWWAEQFEKKNDRKFVFPQDAGWLSGGIFVTKNITVEVSLIMRVDIKFKSDFRDLLALSGHEDLIEEQEPTLHNWSPVSLGIISTQD